MNPVLIKKAATAIKNWWVHLLAGILFIIMAIWVMSTPVASFVGLSVLFSIVMFVSGLFEIIFAITNRDTIDNWGWYLVSAIIDFLIGIVLLSYPGLTMAILGLLVAFWLMFKGFSAIGIAIDLRHYKAGVWIVLLLIGIVALLLSFLIIADPIIGGVSIVYIAALSLLATGIFKIVLALRLKRLHDRVGY